VPGLRPLAEAIQNLVDEVRIEKSTRRKKPGELEDQSDD
jgi:hypothetical protein